MSREETQCWLNYQKTILAPRNEPGCNNNSLIHGLNIKRFTDKCNLHCCHNSYHSRSDFIVNDVEINYTQLALGVSQLQLLCLHAVVEREMSFESAL